MTSHAGCDAEDAGDVAIYDARKAELAKGGGVLPPEVSAAILRGESRLKAIRNWRRDAAAFEFHDRYRSGLSPIWKAGAAPEPPRPSRSSRRL